MTLHGIAMGDQPFEYIVPSESDAGKVWRVYTHIEPWKCTCPGHLKHHHCKHIQMVQAYLAEMEGGREPEEGEDHARGASGMITPPPPTQNSMSKWIVKIHGQETIRYQGLLAMAHEQGLIELKAEFISVTDTLALAAAYVVFKDGRKFWDAADATPTNVRAQVKAHFARMALTRAKARALRDALNIGMVSLEELEE